MLEFIVIAVSFYIASKKMSKAKAIEKKDAEIEMWRNKIRKYIESPYPKKMSLQEYCNMINDLEEMNIETKNIELD